METKPENVEVVLEDFEDEQRAFAVMHAKGEPLTADECPQLAGILLRVADRSEFVNATWPRTPP